MFTTTTISYVNPNMHAVWIFTMFSVEDSIIVGLSKKGYKVSALNTKGTFTVSQDNSPSVCIALMLEHTKSHQPKDIYKDITDLFIENKTLYYGIVISQSVNSTWNIGNITLPGPKNPTPSNPNNHLKVIK